MGENFNRLIADFGLWIAQNEMRLAAGLPSRYKGEGGKG